MVDRSEDAVVSRLEQRRRQRPRFDEDRVTMAHGAGGKASRRLVEGLVVPTFENEALAALGDAALLDIGGATLAFTTDAFVVHPIVFPGGSIGELAINGTVNDLAVSGARPAAVSVALVLEEGLERDVLERELEAMAMAAEHAEVILATGDTKVVQKGKADSMYVVTSGIGEVVAPDLSPTAVRVGDKVLVSGTIGDHGTAIMLARGELDLVADVASDTRSLWPVARALMTFGADLRCMRDATRGGVATVLNEIALAADVGVVIAEDRVPIRPEVRGAGELLGIDPLYVANEGTLVAFVAPDVGDDALAALRDVPGGEDAAVIGEVRDEPPGRVLGLTQFGGHRMIDMLVGDPLPRIC